MSHTTITFVVLAAVVVVFVLDRLPVAVVAIGVALTLWATGVLDFLVLIWVLVGALVACVLILLARRLRDAILDRIRRRWPGIRASLVALRASHKLALLLLGSLATELLFAIALGLFARAFGAHIDLTELLVINISVSLLASFIPVPGGIGVAEFGLTIGLTSAGMAPAAAIAAVLLYRISTYYLPPAWGFPAMLWLHHNRYL